MVTSAKLTITCFSREASQTHAFDDAHGSWPLHAIASRIMPGVTRGARFMKLRSAMAPKTLQTESGNAEAFVARVGGGDGGCHAGSLGFGQFSAQN